MEQFRELSRTGTNYSIETYTTSKGEVYKHICTHAHFKVDGLIQKIPPASYGKILKQGFSHRFLNECKNND